MNDPISPWAKYRDLEQILIQSQSYVAETRWLSLEMNDCLSLHAAQNSHVLPPNVYSALASSCALCR
ncbi:hypothetical protein DPEC_G00043060 [Dallia pectoralis]|uniref:Uncharacterized protein n=1 Tax=Dallia pectoralis TaxID=75939 RepID=A0ACC2H9L9_DALPE|nr:hypothetical protein DPEC_G00043060 [Dallia pectoralis]